MLNSSSSAHTSSATFDNITVEEVNGNPGLLIAGPKFDTTKTALALEPFNNPGHVTVDHHTAFNFNSGDFSVFG